jgi:hypothetical protein
MAAGDFSAKRGVKVKKPCFLLYHAISSGSELIENGQVEAV